MIHNLRIDYTGSSDSINMNKLAGFISDVQEMLDDIADEINQQQATLVIKVYDGQRMTYSFENISAETNQKINRLLR